MVVNEVFSRYPEMIDSLYSHPALVEQVFGEGGLFEFIKHYNIRRRPSFPITGNDLLKIGINGQPLGSSLKQLKNLWLDSDFKFTKEQLLKYLTNEKL
jgi:hypothetical protein